MTVNTFNLQLALANACMNPYELCRAVNIQYQTYRRISNGCKCKPKTIGKIAKALNVPVDHLINLEGGD